MTLAGQSVVFTFLEQHFSDANVVNIAGRQRMLSQRLSKAALIIQTAIDAGLFSSAIICHCEAYLAEAIPVLQAGDCFVRFASSQ